jgi:hypothetical protein
MLIVKMPIFTGNEGVHLKITVTDMALKPICMMERVN